ncbi:hypothetical protein [Thauera sp.]|uniref:hypothetical protein n=1 Tax=Thauera sp. TaxID=1905334 RepID=UPI0039E27C51
MARASSSELQRAIDRLLKKEPGWKNFIPKPAVGARPGGIGTGQPASGGSTGVTLEERDASLRTYHAGRPLRSVNGILTFIEEPIESITLVDGKMIFADPGAGEGEP